MDALILENVRCFGERQEVPLKPLTVLVGENSSGKSTFLAATRIASELGAGQRIIDFNEDPFRLGAYEQIATYRGGRAGRATSFTIGQDVALRRRDAGEFEGSRVEGCFESVRSQPFLKRHSISSGGYGLTITSSSEESSSVVVTTPEGEWGWTQEDRSLPLSRVVRWSDVLFTLQSERGRRRAEKAGVDLPESAVQALQRLVTQMRRGTADPPYAFAPVRSRPQRTYDPVTDVPNPEGQHVPMVLARLLSGAKESQGGIGRALADFGKASGLFTEIDIHRLGRQGDPFQVQVKMSGPRRNLIDVGYGVSQILPILVEVMTGRTGRTFLIQQPEVHLHPRAQAALATLFGRLAKTGRCRLVVETHSDYFIDRLRMDVRDGAIRSEDVSLLYFELGKTGSTIYPIGIDERGNVVDAPPTYRRFFLDEERRFFGGS